MKMKKRKREKERKEREEESAFRTLWNQFVFITSAFEFVSSFWRKKGKEKRKEECKKEEETLPWSVTHALDAHFLGLTSKLKRSQRGMVLNRKRVFWIVIWMRNWLESRFQHEGMVLFHFASHFLKVAIVAGKGWRQWSRCGSGVEGELDGCSEGVASLLVFSEVFGDAGLHFQQNLLVDKWNLQHVLPRSPFWISNHFQFRREERSQGRINSLY